MTKSLHILLLGASQSARSLGIPNTCFVSRVRHKNVIQRPFCAIPSFPIPMSFGYSVESVSFSLGGTNLQQSGEIINGGGTGLSFTWLYSFYIHLALPWLHGCCGDAYHCSRTIELPVASAIQLSLAQYICWTSFGYSHRGSLQSVVLHITCPAGWADGPDVPTLDGRFTIGMLCARSLEKWLFWSLRRGIH